MQGKRTFLRAVLEVLLIAQRRAFDRAFGNRQLCVLSNATSPIIQNRELFAQSMKKGNNSAFEIDRCRNHFCHVIDKRKQK